MKLLLDECIDWRLSRLISGHEVKTARQLGWTSVRNGELLRRASTEFDIFVTVDRNLAFQQNATLLPIAIVIPRARTNRLPDLVPLVPALLDAVVAAKAGEVILVGA